MKEEHYSAFRQNSEKKLAKGHQTADLSTVAKVTALASTLNFELQTLAKPLSNCCKAVINALLNTSPTPTSTPLSSFKFSVGILNTSVSVRLIGLDLQSGTGVATAL